MAGRPEIPGSIIVNLNSIIENYISERDIDPDEARYDIDIVIPIYSTVTEKKARNAIFLLDKKMYRSRRSNFIEPITTIVGKMKFYFYDSFKNYSKSHKNSYTQGLLDAYHENGMMVMPYYWRVD